MSSSLKVKRYDKYVIESVGDWYYIVNEDCSSVIAKAKTYDKAAKHITNSTGKYPRCVHQYEFYGTRGEHYKDRYRCIICGRRKYIKRFLPRVVNAPKDYYSTKLQKRRKRKKLILV